MREQEVSEFGKVLIFIVGAIVFCIIALTVSKLLRPDRPNEEKLSSYECGEEAVGNPWGQFNIRFYIIALIFLLFEVEMLFLFPWSVVFGNKQFVDETNGKWGWFSLVEVFIFVGILVLGLAYAWVKGYLDWIHPEQKPTDFKSSIPASFYEEINRKYERKN